MEKVRIDRYIYAVRVFKTRALSAEACTRNKVRVGEQPAKPSKMVGPGDVIHIRFGPFERILKVLKPVERRQPARLVPDFMEELTPDSEVARMKAHAAARAAWRLPGVGRPTKKDRRDLDDFLTFDDW